MLAKLTSKNQLTLPKKIIQKVGRSEYFEISVDNGKIILAPLQTGRADAVRDKLTALGISEDDVADAVAWARRK